MSQPHSKLVQDSIIFLNSLKCSYAFSYTPSPYGKRSVSDIIFCHRGYFCVIEIKIGKDIPTPLQRIFQRKIKEKANGFAAVCWSLEEVKQFVKKIDQVINGNSPDTGMLDNH